MAESLTEIESEDVTRLRSMQRLRLQQLPNMLRGRHGGKRRRLLSKGYGFQVSRDEDSYY